MGSTGWSCTITGYCMEAPRRALSCAKRARHSIRTSPQLPAENTADQAHESPAQKSGAECMFLYSTTSARNQVVVDVTDAVIPSSACSSPFPCREKLSSEESDG